MHNTSPEEITVVYTSAELIYFPHRIIEKPMLTTLLSRISHVPRLILPSQGPYQTLYSRNNYVPSIDSKLYY